MAAKRPPTEPTKRVAPKAKRSASKKKKKKKKAKSVAPGTKRVVPEAKRVAPEAKRVAPEAKRVAPEAKRVAPTATSPAVGRRRRTARDRGIAAHEALVAHALSYPGAVPDHPWGELVVKVAKKVFVFFGRPSEGELGLSAKLPRSGGAALMSPFATPTGYGLGKSGWVSCVFREDQPIPVALLKRWIDESYRAVAPKKLVSTLPPLEEDA